MKHAMDILQELDKRLTQRIPLTLYGKAALCLGFPSAPPEYAASMDVDGVLETGQAERWLRSTNFWEAVNDTNQALSSRGLYISHFFEEKQIILTSEWRENRVALPGAWKWLDLTRLGNGDLFLSKLMRYDPQDIADARFIATQAGFSQTDIRAWIARAQIPDILEIKEQFELCIKEFL